MVKVKCIKMCLHDGDGVEREIGRVYEDHIQSFLEPAPFMPDLQQWYNDSFYNISNSKTFEQRFKLVEENHYMCFSKPALRLYACEVEA